MLRRALRIKLALSRELCLLPVITCLDMVEFLRDFFALLLSCRWDIRFTYFKSEKF